MAVSLSHFFVSSGQAGSVSCRVAENHHFPEPVGSMERALDVDASSHSKDWLSDRS